MGSRQVAALRTAAGAAAFAFLLAAVTLGSAPAAAASPWQNLADPVFVRVDTRALPEAAVMALAQDSAGFVWIGTQGGLARYDGFIPSDAANQRFYCAIQRQWLRDEEYLLGTRLGRSPTAKELFIDFMNNHNGLRFRAFFAMKFPSRVKFCKCPTAASPAALESPCQPCSKN